MKPNQWTKRLSSIGLGAALLFTGAAWGTAAPAQAAAQSAGTAQADQVIATARSFMGVPYQFGAKAGDTSHFDCSSFVQYVYGKHGVSLPRTVKPQAALGTPVAKSDLKPGDLVFFYSPMHHVGIYIGGGKFIHTYGEPGVTISDLESGWWAEHYNTARRL
ncbi:hypothetical protein J31TS4_14180 [Paenibacillus sp. J31TS4]|uniref:C40 family peptidase n=1 Tax=Paenibacillus sp. J31TS4 TaxID=2807195 RepID=UPI001B2CF341|nr:C40 family peptidase [Paenibacillus sp. J31TS4]GIP38138.1 hypothetical protein J31TS4_14180 [Paenibacillus sp. J31TS4]